MEKIDAKVIMYALLPVLLLQYSSLAGAVDITFFYYPLDNSGPCTGPGYVYLNASPNVCHSIQSGYGGSVLFNNAGSNVLMSLTFGGGSCSTSIGTGPGTDAICWEGPRGDFGYYTGALWYNGNQRRSLLANPITRDARKEPNSVIFTEESGNGTWILTTSNVDQLYSEMLTVPDSEKPNWLKSRGAIFDYL